MPDLLIELFSEEIPAGMQAKASADLERLVGEGLRAAGLTEDQPLLFLCRSGVRSAHAAMAATAAGFGQAFNVAEGFEGEVDGAGHRGTVDGWKVAGLPWRQS